MNVLQIKPKQYHFFIDMGPDSIEVLVHGTSQENARACVLNSLSDDVKSDIRNIELVKAQIKYL